MTRFSFAAKSLAGEELDGEREAKDKYELAKVLRQEGYILTKAEEAKRKIEIRLPAFLGHVGIAEKMLFARNLAVMVSAGLSLARGLEVLSSETQNKAFKSSLTDIADFIRKGGSFSDGLRRHPKIFSNLFVAMVEAGEKTGKLDDALKLISKQLKKEYDLRRRVRSALMYPAIIMIAMAGIGVLMLIYVVPTLVATFEELGVALPTSTRVIIAISSFLVSHVFLSLGGLVLLGVAGAFLIKNAKGKRALEVILHYTPILSGLVRKINAARTCRTLGSLVGAGVEILEALRITESVIQNHYYKDVLASAKSVVEKGEPISKIFLARPDLYPLLVGEMMEVGEETGKLSEMLFRLAVFYEGEVSAETKDLSTVIEPALMVIIGIAVGFFAVAMIKPLYSVVGAF